jgi:hypothetical protein
MNFDCIVSQVHIPDYDVQGGLSADEKLTLVEFGIRHLRAFNPNSYIIVTGHGRRPGNLDVVNWSYWEDECRPLNKYGYVDGMPAQFFFVSMGLDHAVERGFDRVIKTRGDCILGIPNAAQHYNDILELEDKRLLLTQQTGPERMGDCLMYGDAKLLAKTWSKDNPVHSEDGLQNTAINYRAAIGDQDTEWLSLLQRDCSFRDVHHLKFMCLRWNYRQLEGLSQRYQRKLLDHSFKFDQYHWGRTNGWHRFDHEENMSGAGDWLYSEKSWYGR